MKRTMKCVFIFIAGALLSVDGATVSGIVKDSASGSPVSEIFVSLRKANITLARDTTDANGAFSLSTDSSGAIIVRARDLAADPNYTEKDSTMTLAASDSKTITIHLVKIPKTTISGTVRSDSATGAPIAGAIVSLRSGAMTARLDTADADGKYQFDNVTVGTYFLSATAAKHLTNNVSDTVKLTTTRPVAKNIFLASIVYGSVSGLIGTDAATSVPIAGAIVTLRSALGYGGISLRDTTGADGKYQFDSVQSGSYLISATAAKFLSVAVADTIKIASVQPIAKNVTMSPIVYVTVSGIVGDDGAASAPIAGAIVTLRSVGGVISPVFGGRRDTSGADGAYRFDSVENGNYILSATASKYLSVTVSDTVKVTSAQPITQKIIMKLIVYSSIAGTITNGANAPLSKALVTIRQVTAGTNARRDSTGEDGKYNFDSLLTGKYIVTVTAANFFTKSDTHELTGTPLILNIQVFPILYAKISGIVTDSIGKAVAGALVLFTRSGTTATRTATTAADGGYTLDSVTTGTLSVVVNGIAKIVPLTIISASPQTVNISYKASGIITVMQTISLGRPMVGIGPDGCLRLKNFSGAGIVRIVNASGRQVFIRRVRFLDAQGDIPLIGKISSGTYSVSVTRESSVVRSRIFVP